MFSQYVLRDRVVSVESMALLLVKIMLSCDDKEHQSRTIGQGQNVPGRRQSYAKALRTVPSLLDSWLCEGLKQTRQEVVSSLQSKERGSTDTHNTAFPAGSRVWVLFRVSASLLEDLNRLLIVLVS